MTRLWLGEAEGSAILEFAIAVPLLVVFVVGIYDFAGAFNQKQKIEQAAQEAAIVAAAQPTSDFVPLSSSNSNPDSLQPVVAAVINSLTENGVLTATCTPPGTVTPPTSGLSWQYSISGCSGMYPASNLVIVINRGSTVASGAPYPIETTVSVTFPYNWRFNSVIQLLFPNQTTYQAVTSITESAIAHTQT